MPAWLRRTLIGLGFAAVVLGIVYYWFLGDGGPPSTVQPFPLVLESLRALAGAETGDRPTEIRVERVADFNFPAIAAVGGDGWTPLTMAALSYQIVFLDRFLVLDTAFDSASSAALPSTPHPEAYARMQAAMAAAAGIYVTHEHPDHIGGIAAYPDPAAILPVLRLTDKQLAAAGHYAPLPQAIVDGAVPLIYEGSQVVAPGVVLVAAPGHTPGSQMVFVELQDGEEFLFIGDIGWTLRNVETGKGRPRALSAFMLKEDRDAVFGQLAAIAALHRDHPEVHIVPGHDAAVIEALLADGSMLEGFR